MKAKYKYKPFEVDAFRKIREEFGKSSATSAIRKQIKTDLAAGVSPVEGERWAKYSESYKEVIRGKAMFRRIGGKTIRLPVEDKEVTKHKKKVAPVNLKLSGKLHNSLYVKFSARARALVIGFKNELANIHNDKGAGKSKVIRRLLPTNSGERLNQKTFGLIIDYLNKAADKVIRKQNKKN